MKSRFLAAITTGLLLGCTTAGVTSSARLPLVLGAQIDSSTNYYDIIGQTMDELKSSMRNSTPVAPFAGETRWNLTYTYKVNSAVGMCRATAPDVRLRVTTTLPRLAHAAPLDSSRRAEWNRFDAALRHHEGEHLRIVLETTREILRQIEQERSPDCSTLTRTLDDNVSRLLVAGNRRNKEFDNRTVHGADEGASLYSEDQLRLFVAGSNEAADSVLNGTCPRIVEGFGDRPPEEWTMQEILSLGGCDRSSGLALRALWNSLPDVQASIAQVRAVSVGMTDPTLLTAVETIVRDTSRSTEVRLAALEVLMPGSARMLADVLTERREARPAVRGTPEPMPTNRITPKAPTSKRRAELTALMREVAARERDSVVAAALADKLKLLQRLSNPPSRP